MALTSTHEEQEVFWFLHGELLSPVIMQTRGFFSLPGLVCEEG